MDNVTRFPEPGGPGRGRIFAAKIRRAAADAGIGPDDSLAPLIEALAELPENLEQATDGLIAQMQAARQPITDNDVSRLAHSAFLQMDDRLAYRMVQFNKAGIAIGVLVALALGAAGFGAGWWWHGEQGLVAGVSAGQTECQDVKGGTLCRIPVWAKLPPAGAQ